MASFKLKFAFVFYGILSLVAIVCAVYFLDGVQNLFVHPDKFFKEQSLFSELFFGIVAGLLLGIGVVGLTRFAVYRFSWARNMHLEFRGLLGPLGNTEILIFALLSAIGEELLFRGLLQSTLGIVFSSLIFGILHVAPGRKFIPWPVEATIIGFAFGFLFWLTGTIIASIIAHFVINYKNLHFINAYDPSLQFPKSFGNAKEHKFNSK